MKHKHLSPIQLPYAHALPAHKAITVSPLAPEAPVQDYRGFQNLIMLLLAVNNIRLMVENYLKYGLLIGSTPGIRITLDDLRVTAIICVLLPAALTHAFLIEWIAIPYYPSGRSNTPNTASNDGEDRARSTPPTRLRRRSIASREAVSVATSDLSEGEKLSTAPTGPACYVRVSEYVVAIFHLLNIFFVLVAPNFYASHYLKHPLLISIPCFSSVVLAMKLGSWMLVNRDLRKAALDQQPLKVYGEAQMYPQNVSLSNLIYFSLVPTLCYQPSYPRMPRFRLGFFFKRLFELVSILLMMYFLVEQYIRPTLHNSLRPFHMLNVPAIFERILKLSIPSLYIWLLMFYAVFHSYLNLAAEVLLFGDRNFYRPWWNARTIAEYWRLWNLPVYQWFKRHIYVPMITKHGMPPWIAGALAFFISAIGHEIVVGIPTGVVEGWAFGGMMGQIPLIWLTEWVSRWERRGQSQHREKHDMDPKRDSHVKEDEEPKNVKTATSSFGNYLFWISFCILGQPISVLMYYRAWYMREHPELVEAAVRGHA